MNSTPRHGKSRSVNGHGTGGIACPLALPSEQRRRRLNSATEEATRSESRRISPICRETLRAAGSVLGVRF